MDLKLIWYVIVGFLLDGDMCDVDFFLMCDEENLCVVLCLLFFVIVWCIFDVIV